MATSKTAAGFAGRITRLAKVVAEAPEKAIREGAEEAKRSVDSRIKAAVGGDMTISGAKAKIGSRVTMVGGGATPGALVAATGRAFGWVEFGTHPHIITSKRGGRSKRRRQASVAGAALVSALTGQTVTSGVSAPIRIPGAARGWRQYAIHKGSKGKEPFQDGIQRSEAKVVQLVRREVFGAVRRAA